MRTKGIDEKYSWMREKIDPIELHMFFSCFFFLFVFSIRTIFYCLTRNELFVHFTRRSNGAKWKIRSFESDKRQLHHVLQRWAQNEKENMRKIRKQIQLNLQQWQRNVSNEDDDGETQLSFPSGQMIVSSKTSRDENGKTKQQHELIELKRIEVPKVFTELNKWHDYSFRQQKSKLIQKSQLFSCRSDKFCVRPNLLLFLLFRSCQVSNCWKLEFSSSNDDKMKRDENWTFFEPKFSQFKMKFCWSNERLLWLTPRMNSPMNQNDNLLFACGFGLSVLAFCQSIEMQIRFDYSLQFTNRFLLLSHWVESV